MLFNSAEFIFLFLPITLLGFYSLAKQGGSAWALSWLIAASLFFYGWWKPAYLGLLIGSVLVNYTMGRLLVAQRQKPFARVLLATGVGANLAVLGYYKYANFFVDNINAVVGSSWHLETIILPLAISFFTFQQIAYLVDQYRGLIEERQFRDYALFVTFFPQLIAGPIVHHRDIMPQFLDRDFGRFLSRNLVIGLSIFILGLFKKTIIADGMAPYANNVFAFAEDGQTIAFLEAWAGALAYSLQLYFDFSGYSDMAIGLARMFGLRLPLNFNSPYQASSMIDFWRRWHMTLSQFLRDYLYVALGGNRKGPARRYLNLFLTMLLGGLWHGAGWNFVLWGALHGMFLSINHGWRTLKQTLGWSAQSGPIATWAARLLTLTCVVIAWVYFRAESLQTANHIVAGMFGLNGYQPPTSFFGLPMVSAESSATLLGNVLPLLSDLSVLVGVTIAGGVHALEILAMLLPFVLLVLLAPNVQQLFDPLDSNPARSPKRVPALLQWRMSPWWAGASGVLAAYAFFGATNVSEFLYFNF